MSDGRIGIKTTVEYDPTNVPPAAPVWGGAVKIAQARSVSGLAQEAEEVDITNFDSPNFTREFIAGLLDSGSADMELIYKASEAQTVQGLLRLDRWFRIRLPDGSTDLNGSTLVFAGYIQSFNWEIVTDAEITNGVTIRITGPITFDPTPA